MNNEKLIKKYFPGYILTYAISSLGGCISSLSDGLVVSNLLTVSDLAAMGLVTPYYTILSMLGAFFYTGAQIQCSRALGRGDREDSDRWFSLTIEAALALAAVLMVLCYAFTRQIAVAMGTAPNDAELMRSVTAFSRGFFLNIPFSLLNSVLVMTANADGNKKLVSLSVAVTVIVDTVFNILAAAVFHMGLFGIALATTLATASADVVLIIHILRGKSMFRLRLTPIDFRRLADVWRYGIPKLTNKLLVIITTLLFNRMLIEAGGTVAMGSMSVLGSLSHILLTPAMGIGSTAFLMSSVFDGEDDSRSLRDVFRCVMQYSLVAVGMFAVLIFIFARPITGLFLREQGELFEGTVHALRIYVFSLPVAGIAEGYFGYVQGTANTGIAQVYTLACQAAKLALMYALTALIGTDGVWWSYALGAVPGLLMTFAVILIRRRAENARVQDKLLLISPTAMEAEKNSAAAGVSTAEEAAQAATLVRSFCEERGLDEATAAFAEKCTGEMTQAVIAEGERSGEKILCSVRIVAENDGAVLRIRDDCRGFSTEECFRQSESLAGHEVKDVLYVTLIKMNTLIVRC